MNDQDLQLLDAWRHDRICQSEFEVLQARLKTDAQLRAELRKLAEIEEGLSGLALTSVHDPSMATGGETLPTSDSKRSSWLPWSIATVACLAAVAAMIALLWPDAAHRHEPHSEVATDKSADRELVSGESFGQLVRTSAVRWGDATFQPGDRVKAGRVQLVDGTAEFSFDNGVRMVLSGPAEIELRDAMHAWLHSGKVMFRVPSAATGFKLETKEAEIVDLGTMFGVEAGSQGDCLMQVYEGEVMASAKLDTEARAKESRVPANVAILWAAVVNGPSTPNAVSAGKLPPSASVTYWRSSRIHPMAVRSQRSCRPSLRVPGSFFGSPWRVLVLG